MTKTTNKTIFLVIEEGFTARSVLRSGFLDLLKKEFSRIVIFSPAEKIDYYKEKFGDERILFEPIRLEKNTIPQRLLFKIMKFSIHTNINRVKLLRTIFDETGKLKRNRWLLFFPFLMASWALSRFAFWRMMLRGFYARSADDKYCLGYIQKYKPLVVYANYSDVAVNDFNLKLFKTAKNNGVPTIGNIFSWDNLYSKVFITLHTDYMTVPNELVKKDAQKLGDYPVKNIHVVGSPHFDAYANDQMLKTRQEFFREIGADPSRKLIMFAFGNRTQEVSMNRFLRILKSYTEKNHSVQVYVRPYPKRYFEQEILDEFGSVKNFIFEEKSQHDFQQSGRLFEFGEDDSARLANLLHHADVLATFYSTMPIDSAIANCPTVVIDYSNDEKKRGKYYTVEIHRIFEHIKYLQEFNAFKSVKSDSEFIKAVDDYLQNRQLDEKNRKALTRAQMISDPHGSSKRILSVIKNTI